jgi:outer membrane protein
MEGKIIMLKKTIWFWSLLFCLSWMVFPQPSQATGFEAAFGIAWQNPQGGLGYKGDSLDLNNDLKYSGVSQFFGRAKIELPFILPNLYLLGTPLRFDGTGTKNTAFQFGDQTFNANVPFSSALRLDHYDLGFYYGLPFLKQSTLGMFNIDLGLNLRVFDLKAEVSQAGNLESKSFYLPVPMAYLGVQVKPINSLSLEGEVRAVSYNSNQFYDLIGRVKYSLFQFAFVSAGYRYEKFTVDQNDVKLDVKFNGPLLEVGLQF